MKEVQTQEKPQASVTYRVDDMMKEAIDTWNSMSQDYVALKQPVADGLLAQQAEFRAYGEALTALINPYLPKDWKKENYAARRRALLSWAEAEVDPKSENKLFDDFQLLWGPWLDLKRGIRNVVADPKKTKAVNDICDLFYSELRKCDGTHQGEELLEIGRYCPDIDVPLPSPRDLAYLKWLGYETIAVPIHSNHIMEDRPWHRWVEQWQAVQELIERQVYPDGAVAPDISSFRTGKPVEIERILTEFGATSLECKLRLQGDVQGDPEAPKRYMAAFAAQVHTIAAEVAPA